MHPRPSPQLNCSSTKHGKHLRFNVKKSHISKTSCNMWGHHTTHPFCFMHYMHSRLFYFIVIVIMKVMSQSSHLPWELVKVILWGGALFVLAHFRALHFIVSHFTSCLFPSIVDDTHIIGPLSIVSSIYEHFMQ
jgi:hypothetical protein